MHWKISSRKNELLHLGINANQRRSASVFRTCLALDVSRSLLVVRTNFMSALRGASPREDVITAEELSCTTWDQIWGMVAVPLFTMSYFLFAMASPRFCCC